MRYIINMLRKNKFIIGGFILPLMVWIFSCIVMAITPFGPYSLLISDLDGGYIDALTAFRNIILDEKSLAYTWGQIQGSTPFASLGIGTLISTFNFVVLFTSSDNVLAALTWIIILRIACCGATCAFYLKKTFKRDDISISIFAWCYALMAYAVIYYFHIIWLDQIMMLPLILWGVEKILKDKKDYLYFTIVLTLIFFMNFYMAYMTGVFAFLYFIYRYLTLEKEYQLKAFAGKLGAFLISPLLALGCSSVLLIPIFNMMPARDGLFNADQMAMSLRYEFSGLMSKLCIGSFDTILPGGLPYIYCGLMVVIFMFFYFLSYSITYKEKLLTFFLGLFMFLSMTVNPLYVAWHGFKPPVYFEGRFTYIVSFFMIWIAYKGYCVFNTISMRQVHTTFGIIGAAIILLNRQVYSYITDESLLYTVVFLVLYYLLIALVKYKLNYKRQGTLLLALLVGLELGNNAMMSIQTIDKGGQLPLVTQYTAAYDTIENDVNEIMDMDSGFYRIEKDTERSMNDGFGIGYPSIGHFDAIYNYEVKKTIGDLGVQTGHNWIRYKGSTPITDMLMNIKYTMIQDDTYQSYKKIKEKEFVNYYQNPYTVSAGFMIANPINEGISATNPLTLQETILNQMLGEKDNNYYIPLTPYSVTKENTGKVEREDNTVNQTNDEKKGVVIVYYSKDDYADSKINYKLKMEKEGPCYMYVDQTNGGKMAIIVNDDKVIPAEFDYGNHVMYLGDFKSGEEVKVTLQLLQPEFAMKNIWFYTLDTKALEVASNALREQALMITKHSDTELEGTLIVNDINSYLYTSIPYDKGWTIYVDGKRIETIKVLHGFLGAKISEGKHTIRLVYSPYGFKLGLGISILSGMVIILLFIIRLNKNKKH